MKKLLLALLLFSVGVNAQLVIGNDTIATRSWVRQLNSGGTVPGLKDCVKGPILQKISNVSSTYLNFLFDGEGVEGIDWIINDSNGNQQRSGNVGPKNNTPGITFNALGKGTYYLVITGSTCKSKISSMQFVVPGDSGGIAPPDPVEDGAIPKFSQTPKTYIRLKNNKGSYTDETPGDYIAGDGLRYRLENGITYRALYWITEIPLMNEDGHPVDFGTRIFANGLIPSIRKEYVAVKWDSSTELRDVSPPWRGAKNQEDFRTYGWDIWLHGNENPSAKSAYLFKTSVTNFTTNEGYDLKTGDGFTREQNPSWLDPSNLVPQFMEHPSTVKIDRAVSIQTWPSWIDPAETTKRLVDGGITHAWWQALHGQGIYKDGYQVTGFPYRIKPAFNWSSTQFKQVIPDLQPNQQATKEQAYAVANATFVPDSSEITDEISEGSYPQFTEQRNWLYSGTVDKIKRDNIKGVHLYGDYGYGSLNLGWNSSRGRDPMNKYYLDLLGPDVRTKLEQVPASGHTVVKNDYISTGQADIRGTVIGAYYAITFLSPDRTPTMGFEAITMNNIAPTQPRIRFSAGIMQSNAHGADVPYKNDGTIKYNGQPNEGQYPDVPAELLKHDSFFSCLYYNGAYLWDAAGVRLHTDLDKFYDSSIMQDNWVLGTRQYAKLIPYLNQANRDIICTDFVTSSDKTRAFEFKTPERRISNSGRSYYYNQYFNEVVVNKSGMLLHIPANKKAFIWLNSYKRPDEIEAVTAVIDGRLYELGEAAGSTLTIFYEK